jgi:PAS domain S-box-containing protein
MKSQALEESTVGITIADTDQPDQPIVYANEGFTRLTGYPTERVLGDNCRFLQGEGTDETTVTEIREAIESESPIRTEILNYRADGTPFWNKLTIAPVTDAEAEDVTHYVGIQEDVTATKRRDRLIEVLNRVLRHNLRNDMGAIQGFAGEIANRTEGETAEMARRITEMTAELTALSEKAQDFQTAVRDADPLAPRDILADVEAVVTELQTEFPETEFKVEAAPCEEVMATERLRLALRELGANAAKHGDSAAVTFTVETTADGEVAVHVQDAGPGLPDVEREVLEAGRETPLEHGSGLGLWLVNWIVTGLGGEVTTTVDEGTTVTVRLSPAADGAVPEYRNAALSTRSG